MKLARVMTALATALTASSMMSGVAYADLVCDKTGNVGELVECDDPVFGTGYEATSVANATSVTVTLFGGDGTIVRADSSGFDINGRAVGANAAVVDPAGGSDTDQANQGELPIATHDLRLFAG
jgi:hypothetical protein